MKWILTLGISFGFFLAIQILDPTKTQLDRMYTGILIATAASSIVLVAFPKISPNMLILMLIPEFCGVLIFAYFGLIYSVLWFVLVFGLIAGFLGWQRHSQSLSSKQKP
jgi:hypothetical protein